MSEIKIDKDAAQEALKKLGACRTLSWPENLVVSIHARTICLS